MQALLLCVCLAVCAVATPFPHAPDDQDWETFGFGVSQFNLQPQQWTQLWSYTGPGVMQYMWITGSFETSDLLMRVYVDGDTQPTYEFTPGSLSGIAFNDPDSPWGTELFGKGAFSGGTYTTLRIPFTSSITYTARMPDYETRIGTLYFQLRGTTNLPIIVGGVTLPVAARLKLYKNDQTVLKPLQFLQLVNTSNSGAVYLVLLAAQSGNMNYLEGCFRSYKQGSNTATLLSTGTEDYFESAYYFNAGGFHFPGAGLTHRNDTAGTLSAYRVHDRDPVFFKKGGFLMYWRNGDSFDPKTNYKCTYDAGPAVGNPQTSTITTYVWTYEW